MVGAEQDVAPGAQPAGGFGANLPLFGQIAKKWHFGGKLCLFGANLVIFGVKFGHFGGELWPFWGADGDATPGAQPAGDAQILG